MMQSPGAISLASTLTSEFQQHARQQRPAQEADAAARPAQNATETGGDRQRPAQCTPAVRDVTATSSARHVQQQRGGVVSEMETEIERRVASEPSGSSVLCESTAVVGSVGGLRGTEKSVQLSGETAAQEQWRRGGTGSVGKQRGQQAAGGSRQQVVRSSSISGTSGSGSGNSPQ